MEFTVATVRLPKKLADVVPQPKPQKGQAAKARKGVALDELISQGESEKLEYKASLRWDIKGNCLNRRLEDVVLKTVAAFGNSLGGSLLIGVSDDGEILGLEADYASLHGGGSDKFQRHIHELLVNQFGQSFVTVGLKIVFHKHGEKEVCEVMVSPADKPLILKVQEKDGVLKEKLFVRSGNASKELPISEFHHYVSTRFR